MERGRHPLLTPPAARSGGVQAARPQLTLRGSAGGRRGPSRCPGSRSGQLGAELPPLAGTDTSPPRLWEQLGKFRGGREASEEATVRDAAVPHPGPRRPASAQTMGSSFPLSLPAPRGGHGSPHTPSGSRRQPEWDGCSAPPPHSGIARALRPIPPFPARPAPPNAAAAPPLSPRPGKADGGGGRGPSHQPQAGDGGVCGSTIPSGRPEGAKAG